MAKNKHHKNGMPSQVVQMVKNPLVSAGDAGDLGSIPGLEIPWRKKWQPAPVFLAWKIP